MLILHINITAAGGKFPKDPLQLRKR